MAKPTPKEPHRPTKYRASYAKTAYQMSLLGATDNKLALAFDVSESTLNLWKLKHPPFSESIRRGKAEADAEVASALFHRAKGYSHEAVKIFNDESGIIEHRYTEHYPPDTQAGMFWLKNRQPEIWRANPEVSVVVNNDVQVDLSKPPEEWTRAEAEAFLKQSGESVKPHTKPR